ncbi:MAG TPA: amino acid adenylation domain-containing protein, partial [Pyrinomonadaceae bacterium]|nr:amino acid adenylation domain-containing protein [Pyrinomonadaceae bacterium]
MSVRKAAYPTNELGFGGTVTTLVDVLRLRANRQPDLIAFTYLTAEQSEEASLTYSELDRRAAAIAALLQSAVKPGDRVLLLYPPGLDYIAAFFGCLYAGAVAVPAYPPRFNETKRRLDAIVDDALPALALTTSAILPRTKSLSDGRPAPSLATDVLDDEIAEQWRMPHIDGDTIAFLQYTSGSTATPKGVIVSHSNLLYNERMIKRAFNQSQESIIVGWLPLYHDMGLIGNLLQPLYLGARCILMSPLDFLRNPFEWLQTISRYRGTTSGGPNFAYDLCVRKVSPAQKARLDLSSWNVAFNGAEPVRAETLDRFAGAFAECGFRREAFRPCYGLAEATLMVSGKLKSNTFTFKPVQAAALEKGRVKGVSPEEKDARLLVGCGTSLLDQEIVIADPNSLTQTPPGQIGELWVSGQNIARGYWNRPEDTEHTFRAFLAGSGDGPFLRTGDLGFIEDGELFITGRLKDLIIIRGLNHYPQDIELTVESSHPSLRPGCGAAFSVDVAGQERLVVIQEVMQRRRADFDEVIASIQQAVSELHELQPYAVVLIDKGSVPKTSSGKIQRQECRARFLEGSLKVVAQWLDAGQQDEPARSSERVSGIDSIQNWLLSNLPTRHGVDARGLDQPISRYHLDSLAAVELMHAVEIDLGVSLPINNFLQNLTIRELAQQISAAQDRTSGIATWTDEETRKRGRLSYGQRALWFLHELNPNSPAYNIAVPVQITGDLDIRKLKRVFQALVDRHACLRTSFSVVGGEPTRYIHDTAPVDFQVCDASRWNQERLDEFLSREAFLPFDLTSDSLLRVRVLSRSKSESILLMVLDHLVADLWSLGLLVDELRLLYSEESAQLDAQKSDFGDYVEWQARSLNGAQGEILWQYWKERLSGELPVLNLPVDHPRPAFHRFLGASNTIRVDAELTQKVISIGESRGATLYTTLLAAFQTLLNKYTGQHDILIGSPTTGRTRAAWSEIVGYFVNPIVLRTDLSDNPTFEVLLEQTCDEVLSALQHQDFPFALLVDRLQPDRSVNHSPVFQVAFAWQRARPGDSDSLSPFALGEAGGRFEAGGLVFESMALKQRAIQFDLTMMVAEVNGELNVSLQYDVELFEAETIRRMLGHFHTLIAHISENPYSVISDLPILTEKERQQILIDWNDSAIDFDSNLCAHELIEAQAGSCPEATAVECDGKYLSYGELNGQANQLAHYLRRLGVGPEQRVGVCMQRSTEMVVALLGILKAGAAYVPLDAAYPQLRLQHMVADSGARVMLVDEAGEQKLSGTEANVVVLTKHWPMISRESRENIQSGVLGDNLAYVTYTSGSTGTPKGVAVPHGGLTNLINWHLKTYRVTREDRATQVASPAFDASVWEVWPYLAAGASIWIPDEETRASVPKLIEYLASNEVTISFLPTPLAEAAIREQMPPKLSLKTLLTGGDKLHSTPRAGLPFELVNHYGPTESSVVATSGIVKPDNSEVEPAIGRPVANTRVYILDQWLQPVAVGVAGEIFIAGAGLARGYLNKADLTAERFIPDPFGKAEGGRMYRSGDVGRYLADGNIQFIGRKDQQVKLRGFRIELGEIEAAMSVHPLVSEAVVELRDSAKGDKYLVGYVAGAEQLTASEIREHLKKRLPEYMAPSRYVVLDHLPLSANGKLDRRALRELAEVLPERKQGEAAKGKRLGAVEEIVAGICSQVLGLDELDAEADFFEMGGHSLLAAQVVSRVREAFSIDLPLRTIFERPVIFDLSSAIEDKLFHARELPAFPRRNVPVNEPLPLSFSQQRVWFLDRLEPGGSVYNIPVAVRLIGNLDLDAFRRALTEIIGRHEALRTVFVEIGAKLAQRIQEPSEVELSVVSLSGLSEPDKRAGEIISRVSQQPFDLSQGPLIRVELIRLSEQQHIFVLVMHHIISDGWSMGVLVRELSALYNAYSAGQQSPLEPLPIQYSDYVLWQREWLSGAVLDEQLSYWKGRLHAMPELLELPTDRLRPAVQSFKGGRLTEDLGYELSHALKQVARAEGVTMFMLLIAAFKVLLYRYTGQEDISIGVPVANRNRMELEALIGLFVNTLVLRTDLSGDPDFQELLSREKEVALGAYAHQDLP